MAGLFGGARRALSNFAQTDSSGRTFGDKLSLIGATLQDVSSPGSGNVQRTQAGIAQRLAAQVRAQQQASLVGSLFGGQRQPTAPLDLEALSNGDLGPETPAQAPGLPTVRDAAPALARAAAMGMDISDYVALLDKSTPNMQVANGVAYDPQRTAAGTRIGANLSNVNGVMVDTQDPGNANRFVPQVGEGQQVFYDSQGRPAQVRNIPGYAASRAETEGAVTGARSAAQTPYQIQTIEGPDGRPITTSAAAILGSGPIYGQSDAQGRADVIRAEGAANADVQNETRIREAPARVARYEEALSLIPKAITGFAADQRLGIARSLALAGNEQARQEVAATEIYQNLINRDVGPIVKEMVGSANISNSDRELAQGIAGGNINITPQALSRIVRYELDRQRGFAAQANRPQGGAPQIGTVESGYRYKGGNPASPSSWERVQ